MKLKEGTYIIKKEDWEEFYKRVIKKDKSETLLCYPESTKRDMIAYIGTAQFGYYGYDWDTTEIRERCNNRGLTLIEYIPKPKKPKALKLTLEEVMEDVFEEALAYTQFNGMKTLFRKVIIRYLEEVYKEKGSK